MRIYIVLGILLVLMNFCAEAQPSAQALIVHISNVTTSYFSPSPDIKSFPYDTKISFSANRMVNWIVKVQNANGIFIRQWRIGKTANFELTWNGRGAKENFIPSGRYTIRVIGIDERGRRAEDSTIITIDNEKPGFSIKPDPYPSYLTDIGMSPSITFSSKKEVNVEVLAMDETGKRRVYLEPLASANLGRGEKISVEWKMDALPNGNYNFLIKMTDKVGNYAEYLIPFRVYIINNPNRYLILP